MAHYGWMYDACPGCDGRKRTCAKLCSRCAGVGRRADGGPDVEMALDLKVRLRKIRSLGGAAKLMALDPSARAVLLGPQRYGNSLTVVRGGLKARGMLTRRRGVDTQDRPA